MIRVLANTLSPVAAVEQLRGLIVSANPGYPDVLQLVIRDADGDLWHLTTLDAKWSPEDPAELRGRRVVDGSIDAATGVLRLVLHDGGEFAVRPDASSSAGDPPAWEIITPDELCLEFGPGQQWRVTRADLPMGPA